VSDVGSRAHRRKPDLGEQRDRSPSGHQQSDNHQERHPTASELRILDTFGGPALPVVPPGQPVADEQRQPEADHELGEKVLDVEYVAQFRAR
jgi:hypothetical protein